MKKLYILSLCSLFVLQSYAQNILFQDNFDSYHNYVFGSKWVANLSWRPGVMYLVTGSADTACLCNENHNNIANLQVAGLSDCAHSDLLPFNTNKNPNEWLKTTAINLSAVTKAWLKYDSYFRQGNYKGVFESASVLISVNGGNTWTLLQSVAKNKTMSAMETYYLDLSAYTGNTDVRIGFRFMDNNIQNGGWAIDNVSVFEPASKDLSLINFSPEDEKYGYIAINTGYQHDFIVQNVGVDTVKSFIACYQQMGKGIFTDTVQNVAIAPFEKYSYKHSVPDTVTTNNSYIVKAWVKLDGDIITKNDSTTGIITGVPFLPKKIVVVEEGTGTWHYLSPRGHVLMKELATQDVNVCQIAVHDTDPMCIEEYNDYLYYRSQLFIPYFLIDRHIDTPPDSLIDIVKKVAQSFGYAQLTATSYLSNNILNIDASVKPAINMTGEYRLQLVLTENKVTGTGSKWDQVNGYANNAKGAMGGYENKPNPVPGADMQYNYVARNISPSPEGVTNLPSTLTQNQSYTVHFETELKPEWNKNNMHAYILLLRQNDTTILNAASVPFTLSVKNINNEENIDAWLYPNPAGTYTTLEFNLPYKQKASIYITDISGRLITQTNAKEYEAGINKENLQISNLQNGIYFITIAAEEAKRTMKLQVLR